MMLMLGSGDLQYYSYLLQSAQKQEPFDPHRQGFGLVGVDGLSRELRRGFF